MLNLLENFAPKGKRGVSKNSSEKIAFFEEVKNNPNKWVSLEKFLTGASMQQNKASLSRDYYLWKKTLDPQVANTFDIRFRLNEDETILACIAMNRF
jgi:hypothetical protein